MVVKNKQIHDVEGFCRGSTLIIPPVVSACIYH